MSWQAKKGAGGSRRRLLCCSEQWRNELARRCALGRGIYRVDRLARRHEQAVALGAAEADVAAHLGQPNAPEKLAVRRPYGHAIIADVPAGIAGGPEIAVDIAAYAVRSAIHPVNDEVAELLLVGELVVGADVEHEHVALAARTGVARPLASRDDVELLVIRRERDPVGILH